MRAYFRGEGVSQGHHESRGPTLRKMKNGPHSFFSNVNVLVIHLRRKKQIRTKIKDWEIITSWVCIRPFNLANNKGESSTMQQGKESSVGSNTQETHQYVGPYRLEKTLGKGQTGAFSFHFFHYHKKNSGLSVANLKTKKYSFTFNRFIPLIRIIHNFWVWLQLLVSQLMKNNTRKNDTSKFIII